MKLTQELTDLKGWVPRAHMHRRNQDKKIAMKLKQAENILYI